MSLPVRAGAAAAAGLLFVLGSSPHDFWPVTIFGFALLSWAIDDQTAKRRLLLGWVAGTVLFVTSLWWARQFNFAGYVLLALFEATFLAVAALIVAAKGPKRLLALPAAFTLIELLRWYIPFGGLPMGGVTTGQASGPLLDSVAVFGELGLVTLTAALGVALHLAVGGERRWAALASLAVIGVVAAGVLIPLRSSGTIDVALVQGGGPQALARNQQDPSGVFERHRSLTAALATGNLRPQLIVWPENVIILDRPIAGSALDTEMSTLSSVSGATIVAGVVESEGKRFRNAAVVWRDGRIIDRYEKVQRVPFGEYVPGRAFISRFADLSQVPNDAIVGTSPAVVDVGPVKAGVSISFEGLFSRRARSAIGSGGEILLVPTNAASYKSSHVAEAQVQAARLRAVETGRWVLQASPTGISAIVDNEGNVRSQSAIGPSATLRDTAATSSSRTPYVVWGDWPLALASVLALVLTQVGRPLRPSRAGSRSFS